MKEISEGFKSAGCKRSQNGLILLGDNRWDGVFAGGSLMIVHFCTIVFAF